MCGIFGYSFKSGTLSPGRQAILAANFAKLNDRRGGDSWGVLAMVGNKFRITRGLGDLSDAAYHLTDANMLFAHTRLATHGAKTVKNAHPFEIGDIIGAHNGVISNHKELCEKYKVDFDVDSMHLFAHLADGIDFDDMEGYGSIQWARRSRPSVICLAKLSGGELSVYGIGKKDKVEGIVWTSSSLHMTDALKASGIKEAFPYEIDEGQVYSIMDGDIYLVPKKLSLTHRRWTRTTTGTSYYYTGRWDAHNREWQGALADRSTFDDKNDKPSDKPVTTVGQQLATSNDRGFSGDERELANWKEYMEQHEVMD